MQNVNEEITLLITKKLSGEITQEESIRLEEWINASEENKNAYAEYEKLWAASSETGPPAVNIDTSWNQLQERLELDQVKPDTSLIDSEETPQSGSAGASASGKNGSRKLIWYISAAAVILIAVVVNQFTRDPHFIEVMTQNNETREVVFDDGSTALLNHGSKVKYFDYFPDDTMRFVYVWGEAFFDIKKDEKRTYGAGTARPFIVVTENSVIRVFGTKFNVWSRNNETRVFVEEGSVALRPIEYQAFKALILTKGEYAKFNDKTALESQENANSENHLDWLEGKMVFDQTPLSEVIEEIQRKYDIKIELGDETIGARTLTGSFHNQPAEDVISWLCLTLELNYELKNNQYLISK